MFELEKILVQENMNLSRPVLEYKIEESSFTLMTLNGIAEYKKGLREGTKLFYTALSESEGDVEVVTEAFSDFFKKVIELIGKFLKLIQKLFDKFIIKFNSSIKSEKYLFKHKDQFKNFSSENEFEHDAYRYTFQNDIPVIDPLERFKANADSFKMQGYSSSYKNDTNNIEVKLSNFKSNMTDYLNGSFNDDYRGFVIGKPYPISSTDFGTELIRVYRNDEAEKERVRIDKSFVMVSLESFTEYKKMIDEVKNTKERIESQYKTLKKEIENFRKDFKDHDFLKFLQEYINPEIREADITNLSTEAKTNIDLIIKHKAEQVVSMMDIHGLAFAAKLDALKERYVQDKTVLYKALYRLGIREAGIVDIEDTDESDYISKNLGEAEPENILDKLNFAYNENGDIEVYDISGNIVSLDGNEYSLLDLVNPTEKLIKTLGEAGLLTVIDSEDNDFSFEKLDLTDLTIFPEELPNDNNISYELFLASEAFQDADLYNFIQEKIVLTKGENINEAMEMIHENVVDSIKALGRRIWNALVTLYNKFVQTMEELFKSDKGYLEKYKDIILKRAVKINSITSNQYFDNGHGISVTLSNDFNEVDISLNYPQLEMYKEEEALVMRKEFLQKIAKPNTPPTLEEVNRFQDAIMEILKGDTETEYDTKTIQANMKNMYDFCYNYNTYKDSAKSLLDKIEKKISAMEREVDKISKSLTQNESTLLEVEINTSSPSNDDATKEPYKTKSDDEQLGEKNAKKSVNDAILDKDKTTQDHLDNLKKKMQNDLNYYSAIFGAKLSFGQICYKDYMKIIRAHVRMYTKNDVASDSSNKTNEPTNTDIPKKEEPVS